MSGLYIPIILAISVALNIVFVWYILKILSKLLYTSDNLGDLYIIFSSFEEYVDNLFQMEMYHGEPVIEGLIERTKIVREELEKFEEIYSLTTEVMLAEEEDATEYQKEEAE